jgi:4-amino-4-deoxy-L-arabinose transferase-like glycosyltransferase
MTMPTPEVSLWRSPRVAPLLVFALAVLLFSINLDRPPHPDELHHVLAAEGLLETGQPVIAEGEYSRGILHTWMVAASYAIFGEGLSSARLPTVMFEALVALILFLWVRREANILAAWLTAILFVSSPFTVEIAQFSRFYALQNFAFVLGSACVFYALVGISNVAWRILLGTIAVALLTLATSVQITTFVGTLGIAIWTGGVLVHRAFFCSTANSSMRRVAVTVIVALGVLMIVAATTTDVHERFWELFRRTPLHAA